MRRHIPRERIAAVIEDYLERHDMTVGDFQAMSGVADRQDALDAYAIAVATRTLLARQDAA